jgi:hypothetical protein
MDMDPHNAFSSRTINHRPRSSNMNYKRSIRMTLVLALLCAPCLLPLLLPTTAQAGTVNWYMIGKDQRDRDGLCPTGDTVCCQTGLWMADDGMSFISQDPSGQVWEVLLNTPWPAGDTAVQGASLNVQSSSPLQSSATQTGSGPWYMLGRFVQGSSDLCPVSDTTVCCTGLWMADNYMSFVCQDSSGQVWEVQLNTPWPTGDTAVQGATLNFQSSSPLHCPLH